MQLDQYTLNRKLGEGFSAEVFQARAVDGAEYAIKMFDLENPDFSQRAFQLLKEEVEACNQLDHLNIVKLHAF